jgi:chromatin remodeling complex protein RSC6
VNKRSKSERKSDFYVFCLLDCKNQNDINPLKLEQWIFFVVETAEINNVLQSQGTITLNSLKKNLKHIECKYDEIINTIKTAGNTVYSK